MIQITWHEEAMWWTVSDDRHVWEVVSMSEDEMLLVRFEENAAFGALLIKKGAGVKIQPCVAGDIAEGFDKPYFFDEALGWV